MNSELSLAVVTALAGFLLKTSLAFALCLGLSWLAGSPARRFLIWAGLLYGMTGYWLWLARGVLASVPISVGGLHSLAPLGASGAYEIPLSWAGPLGLVMRAMGIVYLLIGIYLLFSHVKNLRQLKWILGFTSQPPGELAEAFQPLAKKLGVGRSRLLILSGATSPATFGWFRPTIVLPDVCLQQDRSELEDILRHELHHVRRADFVWNGLSVVCRSLLFFHPAAWYAARKMGFERELACDLAAVSDSPLERAKYAECLIQFARLNASQGTPNWGIDFAASSHHLKARVHSILAGSRKLSVWLVCSRLACGVALLAAFAYVEPSLGVLLSFAHQQVTLPEATGTQTAPAAQATRLKAPRKIRPSASPAIAKPESAVASLVNTAQTANASPEPGMNEPSPSQSTTGPQLLHRGASATIQRQTVVPIEDGPGQSAKGGDHDRAQAIQQTATAAAGLLKRVGDFDRH